MLQEHISSDSFEVINNTKPTSFTCVKAENNLRSITIDDSLVHADLNTLVDSNLQPRINQCMHVLDTLAQELQ